MKTTPFAAVTTATALALALALAGCAGSYPEPRQAREDSQAAIRAAVEVGAESEPVASLHLRYARDEVVEAKRLVADGDNRKAELVLARARADAELAIAMVKARTARVEADKARIQVTQTKKQLGK